MKEYCSCGGRLTPKGTCPDCEELEATKAERDAAIRERDEALEEAIRQQNNAGILELHVKVLERALAHAARDVSSLRGDDTDEDGSAMAAEYIAAAEKEGA